MTLLQHLRHHTRDLHDATESVAYVDEIKTASLTTEQYTDLLLKNYVIHDRLENALAAAESLVGPSHPLRSFLRPQRVDLLLEDLKALGMEPPMLTMDQPIQIETVPELVGTLYVIEGSALGSKMIAKQLKRSPAIGSDARFQFYETMGQGSGDRWQSFRKIVEKEMPSDQERERATAGARRAFEFIRAVYSGR